MLSKLFVTMGGGVANKRYKNKGFTLAELLAVITILGIIALIVFPAVNKTVKKSKEKSYNQQVESILRSAEHWGLENISNLREERTNYVTIDELKQSGYLEAKNVVNPMTEEEMNGCIVIKYNSAYNQYEYNYNETSCDELRVLPVITLTGESTITIGIGETYNELGATASFEDIDVSSSITITDNIDNSKEGTYQVRYNVTYDGLEAKEVVRTVKVIDKSPVITLKGNSTITIGINETYTDEGATAKTYEGTDISSSIVVTNDVDTTKAGTYTVRYNVTYDGKSAEEVTRTVTVVDKNPVITLNQTGTTGYEQSVTIDVTVTPYKDNTISSIKYKLNGGSEQTVNNNQIVLNTSGEYNLEIIVTDSEGNITTLTSGPYYIDADKPTMTLEVSDNQINDSGWSKEDIIINVTPTDIGGSDIKEYLYCYGNDCTPSITGTGNTITISDEGENNYVCALAIDNAGNESEKVCVGPYKIDKTIEEPTIESTTQANSNGWYKEDINLNITTGTDASGINSIKYCKTNTGTTCTPNTSIMGTSGTVTIDTESSTNYICVLSIDNAGNESTTKCVGPYALDKTVPTLTVPEDVTITTSQVANYNLLDGASATDDVSDIDGSITTSGDLSAISGEYTITYTVIDVAGNSTTKTRKIIVLEEYTVTLNVNNATADKTQAIVVEGNDGSFTLTANSGYKFANYTCTNEQEGNFNTGTFTVENVTSNTTCTINYVEQLTGSATTEYGTTSKYKVRIYGNIPDGASGSAIYTGSDWTYNEFLNCYEKEFSYTGNHNIPDPSLMFQVNGYKDNNNYDRVIKELSGYFILAPAYPVTSSTGGIVEVYRGIGKNNKIDIWQAKAPKEESSRSQWFILEKQNNGYYMMKADSDTLDLAWQPTGAYGETGSGFEMWDGLEAEINSGSYDQFESFTQIRLANRDSADTTQHWALIYDSYGNYFIRNKQTGYYSRTGLTRETAKTYEITISNPYLGLNSVAPDYPVRAAGGYEIPVIATPDFEEIDQFRWSLVEYDSLKEKAFYYNLAYYKYSKYSDTSIPFDISSDTAIDIFDYEANITEKKELWSKGTSNYLMSDIDGDIVHLYPVWEKVS